MSLIKSSITDPGELSQEFKKSHSLLLNSWEELEKDKR